MICYTYVTGAAERTGTTGYVQAIGQDDGTVQVFASNLEEDGAQVVLNLDADHARALIVILQGAVGDLTEAQEMFRLLS